VAAARGETDAAKTDGVTVGGYQPRRKTAASGEWRVANGQTAAHGELLEWLSATTKDGRQVGSRQIGRSENGGE